MKQCEVNHGKFSHENKHVPITKQLQHMPISKFFTARKLFLRQCSNWFFLSYRQDSPSWYKLGPRKFHGLWVFLYGGPFYFLNKLTRQGEGIFSASRCRPQYIYVKIDFNMWPYTTTFYGFSRTNGLIHNWCLNWVNSLSLAPWPL